jgi:hypothetical protein
MNNSGTDISLCFYEAEFVKTRCENSLNFYSCFILAAIWQQLTWLALVLDRCGARHERRNKGVLPAPTASIRA